MSYRDDLTAAHARIADLERERKDERMNHYIPDASGRPVLCDMMTWARWLKVNERHIALTEINGKKVSTVFLGIDHNFLGKGPPILWETMVFGEGADGEMWRYSSREAALAGHAAVVAWIKGEREMPE